MHFRCSICVILTGAHQKVRLRKSLGFRYNHIRYRWGDKFQDTDLLHQNLVFPVTLHCPLRKRYQKNPCGRSRSFCYVIVLTQMKILDWNW